MKYKLPASLPEFLHSTDLVEMPRAILFITKIITAMCKVSATPRLQKKNEDNQSTKITAAMSFAKASSSTLEYHLALLTQ